MIVRSVIWAEAHAWPAKQPISLQSQVQFFPQNGSIVFQIIILKI